ncbi:FusB/FusC family EF-G-binding protein [Lysinibacillus piscis]|uniref:Elongation factor G-binding protein n=1 Tax=Lysinibacillus piscis TaxID=2518931 RepID=A0ABQ5NNH8_9BACI|nr:FusB/FusC family EF-G-binding protein [Lysinibacillus sp. KH24]GLC89646.1 elongation factor G-binding protein [Lysinibacillus sp. KH24]
MTMQIIQPHEFVYIKKEVQHLQSAYKSVNDTVTIQTLQGLTRENLGTILTEDNQLQGFIEQFMDRKLSKITADKLLAELKEFVIPFKQPTDNQLVKSFKKVKKLKMPNWAEFDLRDISFLGWNDSGTHRKYIVLYQGEQLIGYSGTLSPTIQQGVCAVCHEFSNVSLFLTTTKFSGDGTYTKKGNYICHDSTRCNHQLSDLSRLLNFIEVIDK